MSIHTYLRRLARRWRLVLAAVVAALTVATVLTATTDTRYVSKAQLYVASAGDDSDLEAIVADGVQVKGRALSYAAVASSELMAQTVKDDIGLETSLAEIEDRIETEVPFATVLINLDAAGESPEAARELARSIIANYNDVLAQLETADTEGLAVEVATVREPSLPDGPARPRVLLNLLAGLAAGLLLGIALAVLRDLLDDSLQDASDVRALGLVPLGADAATAAVGTVAALGDLGGQRVVVAPAVEDDTDSATLSDVSAALAERGATVVECPASRSHPDARDSARDAAGVVLLATAGRTDRGDLREAALEIEDVGGRVIGVLLRPAVS